MFNRRPRTKKAILAFLAVDATVSVTMLALGYSHRDLLPTTDPQATATTQPAPISANDAKLERLLDRCKPVTPGTIPVHAIVIDPQGVPSWQPSDFAFALWGPDQKPATADDQPNWRAEFCA